MLFIHVKPLGFAGAARLLDQLTTCWTLLLSGKVGDLYSKKTGEVMSNLKKKKSSVEKNNIDWAAS